MSRRDWTKPLTDPLPAPTTQEEWARCLADPWWRICSGVLYKIMIKGKPGADGETPITISPFLPNINQIRFLHSLHNLNVILKARQLGFCVDPSTPVLTADLRWLPIASLSAGDEIVAVDEFPPGGRGKGRKMRTATVEAVIPVRRMAYRIAFDDGREVICTDRHPWLSRKARKDPTWRSISGQGNAVSGTLTVGAMVRWIAKPWGEPVFEDGWMGGLIDGEGSIAKQCASGAEVNVSQRFGPVWDRLKRYAEDRGYSARIENDDAQRESKFGRVPVPKLCFTRMDELFRLIGQTRPSRMIENRFWEGKELPGKRNGGVGWATITSIEPVGERDLIDLQTSTGTYIANGFVSHNTTQASILALDRALWMPNQRCGIIAQDLDVASEILRDKVKFAYLHLPEPLRNRMPLARESAKELLFGHNNSSLRVATTMRGSTIHFLHISEMGKIARRKPQHAREIVTGALPAVPVMGIATIESTAEGQEGEFFDIATRAENMADAKRKPGPLEFKFHFFPWFLDPGYTADHRKVTITLKDHEYFDGIEVETGHQINMGQRAWYVQTRENRFSGDQQKMFQEMPSCVSGDTLVSTPAGIIPIRDVVPDGKQITHHFDQGEKPVFEVVTERGYAVTCTEDHPILCADGEFRKLCDGLAIGGSVQMASPMLGAQYQSVQFRPYPFVNSRIAIDEDFAEFLGLFMGDGSFSHDQIEIACDGQDRDVVDHVKAQITRLFGRCTTRTIGSKGGGVGVRFSSKAVKESLFALDVIQQRSQTGVKRKVHVPPYIMRSPRSVVSAFLRGLFEADGHVHARGNNTRFFSKSLQFVREVQLLLLAFGIESRTRLVTKTGSNGYSYPGCDLVIGAESTRTFAREIGFISKRKTDRIKIALSKKIYNRKPAFDFTDRIASIEPKGVQQVYDITTSTAQFNAGGIVVHNCSAECWHKSTEGTYLTVQLKAARAAGRIGKVPYLPGLPVHTCWDIGAGDGTAIWCFQQVGLASHFIRFIEGWGEGYDHYVKQLRQTGWLFGQMLLPHDANAERQLAKTIGAPISMLAELAPDLDWRIVPRIHDYQAGIEILRGRFNEAWFDEEGCKEGIDHLGLFRKKFNTTLGRFIDKPEKDDGNSEAPDALRQWAQGFDPSHITTTPGAKNRNQRRRATGATA